MPQGNLATGRPKASARTGWGPEWVVRMGDRASVLAMLEGTRRRVTAVLRSLSHASNEQPVHKLALAVLLLLDLFVLFSIFDGLDVHTRQLDTPDDRIPSICREIVIDGSWTAEKRLERLADHVSNRSSPYRPEGGPRRGADAACEPFEAAIDAIGREAELSGLVESRTKLASEIRDSESELTREKGAYDTQLLEALAHPDAKRPDAEAILATVQRRTAAIEEGRARLATLDERIVAALPVAALWGRLDALRDSDRTRLVAELRRLEFWYPVKKLGMQLLFLLPLLGVLVAWHSTATRKDRGLQALVASHLVVVAAIPVLFRLFEALYDVLPKRLLKRLIALLESLKLVALWHYLLIAVTVAVGLGLIVFIQRRVFSRERLLEKRIATHRCQACGKRLPLGANACPACGFVQHRPCPSCTGQMPVHARHCTSCGAEAAQAG